MAARQHRPDAGGSRNRHGEFVRRYWIPTRALLQLQADGDPMRLMLLGELVAFRDSQGCVGIFDHRCPHRCASLYLGRNGKRHPLHLPRLEVRRAGNCVDMPNVPARQNSGQGACKAYRDRTQRPGVGVHGPAANRPALAQHPNLIPGNGSGACSGSATGCRRWRTTSTPLTWVSCVGCSSRDLDDDHPMRPPSSTALPEYEVRNTDWGTMCRGIPHERRRPDVWRVAHFMFPFWTQTPNTHASPAAPSRGLGADGRPPQHAVRHLGRGRQGNLPTCQNAGTGSRYEKFEYRRTPTTGMAAGAAVTGRTTTGAWIPVAAAGTQYTGISNITIRDQAVTEAWGHHGP